MLRVATALLVLLASAGCVWGTYEYSPDCPRMAIKASIARSVRPGRTLTYRIRVKNNGTFPIENLYIDAHLPPYVTYPVPPKREGATQQKPSYRVSPKGLTFDGVTNMGNVVGLENVVVPARKSVTFKVRAQTLDCVPDITSITFDAEVYTYPGGVPDCFLSAHSSNVTIKATTKAQACPAGFVPGLLIGLEEMSGVEMTTTMALAPIDTYIEPNTPAQDALRAEQKAAKGAWMLSSNVGEPIEVPDPVLQSVGSASEVDAAASIHVGYWVDGITNPPGNSGYTPPDPTHAVGPDHIVMMVNSRISIMDKHTGAILVPAKNTNSIFQQGLKTTDPCYKRNDGDPITAWDHFNQRFVISQFTATSPYRQCIAVSRTSDPTGRWWLYSIPLSTSELYDYPKLAVLNDAYVITYNRFTSTYQGGAILLLESPKMAAGRSPRVWKWLTTTSWPIWGRSMLPGGSDNVRGAPPGGTAVPLAAIASLSSLYILKVTWDYAAGKVSLYGSTKPWVVSVASFSRLCITTQNQPCVMQPGTSQRLSGLGDRLLNRLVYNYMGDYDSMVVAHSITTGVRWYEIRNIWTQGLSSKPYLHQQGTFGSPDGATRWFGTMAMDKAGGIGLGYAESGSNTYPSIGIAGRDVSSPMNTMPYAPPLVVSGVGSLSCTCARYGDYASMQVDPLDGCTFYLYHQYVSVPSVTNRGWGTNIVKFNLPGCA